MTNWERIDAALAEACRRAGRDPASVQLLPVSKGQPLDRIRDFLNDPRVPRRLGENYLDELETKTTQLGVAVEWHYLGRLQTRKIPAIAAHASVLHGVERAKELEALVRYASRFYLQVNISDEVQKGGILPADLPRVVEAVSSLGLSDRWLGFMGMAASLDLVGESVVRRQFASLREWRDRYAPGRGLSMGMSDDFALAIAEGSTCVRIGSALFGERTAR